MYTLRGGAPPKSFHVSPPDKDSNNLRRGTSAPDAGGSAPIFPSINRRTGLSPLPSLLEWQRKDVAHFQRSSTASAKRLASKDERLAALDLGNLERSASLHAKEPASPSLFEPPANFSGSPILLSQSSRLGGRTSPGGRNSPPGLGHRSSAVYGDAGRSTVFQAEPLRKRKVEPSAPGSILTPFRTASSGKDERSLTPPILRKINPGLASGLWQGGASSRLRSAANAEELLAQQADDMIHPRLRVLKKSWNNWELFQEYASGLDDPQQSIQIKSLSARKDSLDFQEFMELLRSLQLLCSRDTIIFNPHTQVTTTRVHEIFLQVNLREWLQYVGSSGLDGEANVDQCDFKEYQIIMLCIAVELGVPLGELVSEDEALPEGDDRDRLFHTVKIIVEKARMKGVENKPGMASFMARRQKQSGVQEAFKNIMAARQSCVREEFDQARAQAQYATGVLLQSLRPDLLCEIRLVEEQIVRDENNVIARKKKAQARVENELENAKMLCKELKVQEAKAQISKAVQMSEQARLPMKGHLRACLRNAEDSLEQALAAIEGDKKLAEGWKHVQRDELVQAHSALKEAKDFYVGNEMREAALNSLHEALQKKEDNKKDTRSRGRTIIEKATAEIEKKNFDQAEELVEMARSVFMEWSIPVGRNQSLTEQITNLFKNAWKHEQLYMSFCAFDMDNLSGAGARAMDMDYNELLHLLRSFGILSERSKTEEEDATDGGNQKKVPKSRALVLDMRQQLIDQCTTPEIRKSEHTKIAKADIYTEFRAVNKMSMANLASGNLDADDDMSSLDWGEYQILMMRIARILDVPVTDIGCSPLFSKDVDKVEALRQTLHQAKKEYMNGIIATGESHLTASRNASHDKQFEDAIEEVRKAEAEFKRVWDEKTQKYLLTCCTRQLETIEKERVREHHRQADQKMQGEEALQNACNLLDEFDRTGALFDDHKFAIVEQDANAAQKFFKSAISYSSELKAKILDVLSRCAESREDILRLRQGVSQANENIEQARILIDDLTQQQGSMARTMSTGTLNRSTSQTSISRQATPAHQHRSPFQTPLQLLVDAKELFTRAKVTSEFKYLINASQWLMSIAVERKGKQIQEGLSIVDSSKALLQEAMVAQNSNAELVSTCYNDARKKLALAKSAFRRAGFSDLVLEYEKKDPALFQDKTMIPSGSDLDIVSTPQPPPSKAPSVDGLQICDDLEDEIDNLEQAWKTRHDQEIVEAFKCIEMCKDAIEKKAFNRANECYKRASDLFKRTRADILEATRKNLNQAEIKDRTLSKQIKGEAKTKTEKASEARRQSNFELAVVLSEEALEMCHRCEDQDLLAAAETVKQSAVNMAKETYTAAVEKLKAILADARMDIDKQSFEEAKTGINSGFEILRADNLLLASIRALQHVDPFQEYPTMEDELTALNDEAVTKERTFKAHKEFGLKQGLVQMRRFENIVSVSMHTLQRHTNKRVVKGLHAEVLDVLRLVQHDDGTFGRVEDLKSKVESILKTQSNTDQGVLKQAAQLQHQAETQLKYAKFLEAKRLTMASQWHLIQAEAQENEFAKGENMLATVKTDAIQALKAKSKEFIRLSEKALDAFEQSTGFDTANLQKAIEVAKDCRNCLGQIVNDQLLCAVFYPGTNNHVKWLSWGESTAQEISKFCEFLQALAFVRVVSPPRLTSFDILTAYECPTHMYPIVPVAQCYGDGELMRELPKDGANLQSRTGEDRMGTLISSSEALDILEGKLESPTIKTIEVFEIDWSLIAKTVQERLKSELGKIAELKEREEEEEEEEEEEKDFLLKAMAEDAHGQIEKYQDDEFYRESDNAHDESLECSQDAGIAETASPGNASTLQASVEESNTVGCTPVCSQPSTAPEAPVATSKKPPSPAGETNSDEKIGESPSPSASSSLAPAVDASPTAKTIDMVDALERGDFEAARALVDNGADVNATQSNGENVLLKFLEAKDCSIETMRFLLEHGANVRDVNVESRQVLHLAAMHDRGDIVEEIAASAESSCQNRDAVSVKGLLQVMLDAKDKHGKTPIDLALDSRCTNALGNLVSLGANTLALGSDGLNCIHRAIKQDHREAIPILLDSTKNLESKTATGMTSLMLACEKGNLQLVELLCSRGSKVNAKDEDGRTPLHISAHAGNPEVMRTLLDRGAECESSDVFGCSPAYYCIVQGHTSCLHLLIENSSPLNQTVNGHSLLYIASYLGRIDMVKLMVDSGCPLFAGCTSGFAPLHAATCMGHNRIIETLSKAHAADADSQSEYAQVHRIAQCLAVIKANTTALRTLQDHLPKQDPFSTLRHVVTWDAGKLSALLGRVDLFQLLQGDASAANSRPTTAGTSGAASARLSTSHSADIQTRPSTAETVGLSLHLSTSHGADFQSEVGGSCSKELFPVPHYREDADTDNIVSNILRMLMSDESSVLDIVSMCLEEQVEIVADGAVGSRPQSGISRVGSIEYNTLMKNLVGNKSKSENRDRMLNDVNATDVAHCQIEERMIYACYPMPSLPNPEIRQPLPNYGSTQLDLPDEVESRLLAQDNQLRKMISDAQDHALEQCRVTAATMRLLLKRAKLASIAGSAEEAMGCLSESSSFYGHCSVCLHLKNLEANSSRICKVCELRKQLYDDTRQTILNKLFSFNMECAEKHILLKQAANADRALKLARKWLDDILGDKTPTSAEDKEKQSRLVKLEDHYIHSQVIEQVEDLLRNVCAQDASRRSKMAIKRYSEDLTRLIANVFDLLKAFANNQCNPADISGRIEDLNGIRASFVRCGDLVSMDDYVGLERIQLVIAGINNISQAWTRVKDGLSKAESRDGFSLLLAHKCALECQSLCAASRSDLNRLKFQLTEQAKEPAHDSDGLVLHKSLQLSDTVLMQESKNLGARYLSVAAKVLDQLDEQFEFLFKRVNEQQTSFLEHKMEEALSDLISELEVEGQNEQRMLIESKLHILEEQARQQYKASRYAVCLESIGEWSRTSEIGGVSRSKIENAFHVLQLRDEVTYLRQKQMHAEAKLQEAKSILQSDAEQARQMLVVAQAKFKEVNEGRPEILTQIADISHAIVTVFVEIIVQDNLVNAAISFSENERFRIAKLELQSSLYVAQGHLQKNDLYHCIEFADKALLTFSSQIAELSASCIDMSVSEQLAQVRDEAKDLLVKDDAAALAEEQLSFAQSIYNGANYDDARLQLSVARKIGERAGHRLKDHVRESLDAFARAVDTDEIGSVWKWVVTKVEEVNDAEISSEITALVNNAVANVAGVLSELCGDETIPTPDQLDALVNSLNATVDRAKARVSRLSRPSPNNGLWAAAVALSQECRHLSNCAQARHCLDDYLVSIQDYHNRITKKLPLQRLRIAKNWWQAASDSSLAVGPSGLYVMHENSGIRMEVLRTLLRRCEDETEKSIESAKQRIVECVEKQAAAVQQVLAGDFVAGEQLLLQVVALDMTLNRAFWKRNKQIEDVARTSRRCAELKALAEQQHETTLQLMKEEFFDTARDVAAKCLDTKRLLESVIVENHRLMAELQAAPAVYVGFDLPSDEDDVTSPEIDNQEDAMDGANSEVTDSMKEGHDEVETLG